MKPLRIAINGYGRIGRCFLRALHESPCREHLTVVAINEPAALESIAYLTQFDSTHGRFPSAVALQGQQLLIDGQAIAVSHETTPEAVNWKALGIDLVVECSGHYSTRPELERFIAAGCPRLLLSHPANSAADVDATIVYGINHESLTGSEIIVSNASCTTNAVVPVLDLLAREIGIDHVLLTTLHSVMNDQPLADGYHHADLRRTRSAMQSIIPVSTGLARGVERLLPALSGRVQAKAIRVPTANVSAIDMVIDASRPITVEAVNTLLANAAAGPWQKLLAYTDAPHASVDFNHDPHSAIIDGSQTRLAGQHLLNLLLWFDNEWGF
ncbi:MAG: glyceraldehyde 3-phosphate dehydrogenase NAD-binding domain-containing protein, partial [Rhodocyclaceae bacterium]